MKKIRLDLDSLKVESFVTSQGVRPSDGTVFGMLPTDCGITCNGVAVTCNGQQNCLGMSEPTGCCNYTDPWAITCTGYPATEDPVLCTTTGGGDTDQGNTCDASPECEVKTEGAGW